jgi:hypothetical protein
MTSQEIRERLSEPFDQRLLGWKPIRVSGNRALAFAYISNTDVMDRLDEVVGPENWKTEYLQVGPQSVECRLSIKINGEWVCKSDVGATSDQPDEGDKVKAGYSDGLKRAAVNWGVARYLRNLDQSWCDYDPQKKVILNPPQLPQWALPKGAGNARPAPPQQQRPQANGVAHHPPAPQPHPPAQQQGGADPVENLVRMAGECKSLGELDAHCQIVDVEFKKGVVTPQTIGRVQQAWVQKAVAVIDKQPSADTLDKVAPVFARLFRDGNRLTPEQYQRVADAVTAKYQTFVGVADSAEQFADDNPY